MNVSQSNGHACLASARIVNFVADPFPADWIEACGSLLRKVACRKMCSRESILKAEVRSQE